MSGFSTEDTCPNCGKNCDVNHETRPYSCISYQCYHCGLIIYPTVEYQTLEELNESRESIEMDPLIILPEQDKDF